VLQVLNCMSTLAQKNRDVNASASRDMAACCIHICADCMQTAASTPS